MEIKLLMNSTLFKIIVSQAELNELKNGLDWLIDQGTNYNAHAVDMWEQLKEFSTE